MTEGKSLESLGEEFSTDVSEEFTEDEEETRRTVIDEFFRSNDIRLENYIDDYEKMDKAGSQNLVHQADLIMKSRRIIIQVAGKADRDKEADDIADKWRDKAEEMHEMVKSHPDCQGIYREDLDSRSGYTLKELVSKSQKMGYPKDQLERVMFDIGEILIEYTDWFFEGTEIVTEGVSGDSEQVEGA